MTVKPMHLIVAAAAVLAFAAMRKTQQTNQATAARNPFNQQWNAGSLDQWGFGKLPTFYPTF